MQLLGFICLFNPSNYYSKKTLKEENDLTDENGAQLPETAKVQEYFKVHSQDIHTILLYVKPREITKALTPGMVEGLFTGYIHGSFIPD